MTTTFEPRLFQTCVGEGVDELTRCPVHRTNQRKPDCYVLAPSNNSTAYHIGKEETRQIDQKYCYNHTLSRKNQLYAILVQCPVGGRLQDTV